MHDANNDALRATFRDRVLRLREAWKSPEARATQDRWEEESAAARANAESYLAVDDRRRAGIPDPDAAKHDAPRATEAITGARSFLASDALILLLTGDRGTGKTTALEHVVAQRHNGRFLRLDDVMRADEFDAAWWKRTLECPILAIDEWQGGRLPVNAHARIFRILNSRFESGFQTAIATNLTPEEWQAAYGLVDGGPLDRILDRFATPGAVCVVSLSGPSMRRAPGVAA